MYNSFAASGERTIAIPSVASNVPKIITSILIFACGFVTTTVSPGMYPGDLANNPFGKSPDSATIALPSREGFEAATREKPIKTNKITQYNFFIGFLPLSYFTFKLIESAISQANLLNPTY